MSGKYYYEVKTSGQTEIRSARVIDREFTAKDGKPVRYRRVEITCEDEAGHSFKLYDPDVTRLPDYKRGTVGTFHLKVNASESGDFINNKVTVTGFKKGRRR